MNKYLTAIASIRKTGVKRRIRQVCMSMFLTMCAPTVLAQHPASGAEDAGIIARYPSGSIKSVEVADAALAEMSRERAEIEARLIQEKQACHPKFFATSCIDGAKERRRKEIMRLRSIEIEAHAYKRQVRVDARDQALADRQAKDEADKQERQRTMQNERVTPSSNALDEEKSVPVADKSQSAISASRKSEKRPKGNREKDTLKPDDKRTENIAAYEKKVQAAYRRQQQVIDRKAEKEKKRQMKQAPVMVTH